jgi:hypothetical protein
VIVKDAANVELVARLVVVVQVENKPAEVHDLFQKVEHQFAVRMRFLDDIAQLV